MAEYALIRQGPTSGSTTFERDGLESGNELLHDLLDAVQTSLQPLYVLGSELSRFVATAPALVFQFPVVLICRREG